MIMMAGIDYNLASIDTREKFGFTDEMRASAYMRLKSMSDINGAVLISTCNRTELYISSGESGDLSMGESSGLSVSKSSYGLSSPDDSGTDAFSLLCSLAGVTGSDYEHYTANGANVMRHLCGLAGGLKSQILGEDQIISQVKEAIQTARELEAADSILEVLFRESIAAAKKIKSEIPIGTREDSIALRALEAMQKHTTGKSRVLVIGNGEIGRLMTGLLVENGHDTTMTLRTYRRGQTVVPRGAHTVDFASRYDKLCDYDMLISATRSPHYTISMEKVKTDAPYPKLWLDLAVPRDIDPDIATLHGAVYYDVDALSAGETYQNRKEKELQAGEIIEKYVADFEKWLNYQKVISGHDRKEYFPLFVSSKNKKALVVGGGKIAARRVRTLLQFEFEVTVVAPEALMEIESFHSKGRLNLIRREFMDTDMEDCFIVTAATDNRDVNRHIGKLAAQNGIFASIADRRDECGFLFPAIALNGDIIAGLTSDGKSHHAVSQAARKVREII